LEKEKKLQEQKEMNLLFRPVASQKVEKGKVLIRSTNISFLPFVSFTVQCGLLEQISLSLQKQNNYFFIINNMDNCKQVGVMLQFLNLYLGGTWFKIKIYLLS
jgi:hypothetical protein